MEVFLAPSSNQSQKSDPAQKEQHKEEVKEIKVNQPQIEKTKLQGGSRRND